MKIFLLFYMCHFAMGLTHCYFDTELVSKVVLNLHRGKAIDIDGLTSEHIRFSHPVLPLILSHFFNLILRSRHVPISRSNLRVESRPVSTVLSGQSTPHMIRSRVTHHVIQSATLATFQVRSKCM